jgi:lipopolysaccharide transport system ATP-binding protein
MKGGEIIEDGPAIDIITKYLAKSVKQLDLPEEGWDDMDKAPGNDMVRLHRVRVRRQDGRLQDPLTMQTPFQVEVEYWNLEPGAHLHITLHLYNAEQIIAFATGDLTQGPRPSGLYRSVCHIPANLLNSGSHRFVVLVIKDASYAIYSHESQVSCDILDVREREGAWYGKEPGVVQPVLQWETKSLGQESMLKAIFRQNQVA